MRWVRELAAGFVALAAAAALCLPGQPEANQPRVPETALAKKLEPLRTPPTASYTLHASLDPVAHRVQGRGTIELVNRSSRALPSLYFHLYLNAFKNDRTLFLRSPFIAARRASRPTEYGYLDVKRLVAREFGGLDLWPRHEMHSPLDPWDQTDIEVPLPEPLAPGARLTLEVEFEAMLPSLVERSGHAGSFHMVAQWFPKLARLEPDGSFAHFAFHPHAEFYADFGRYDVTLNVPERFLIGATGRRISEHRDNGRRIERYLADPVHDFAWSTWDRFVEQRATVRGIDLRLLHPPGFAASARATIAAIRAALPEFSRRFGNYPYPNLTVIHPPRGAEPAGGMEYPTLITTGGPWYQIYLGLRHLEAVTVHEFGHQWFYGLLASNEARHPLLDEGLTSYAEMSTLRSWLGPASYGNLLGLKVSGESLFRSAAVLRGGDEAIGQPAAEFSSFQNLGALVYGRVAILIETLARVYGRERLDRALLDYSGSFAFAHPTPADLLSKVREHVGDSAAAFLEHALFERGQINFLVRELKNAPRHEPAGYFEDQWNRDWVRPSTLEDPGYRSQVTVYRHGSLVLPVEVLLIFADGSQKLKHWDGVGEFKIFEHSGASPLVQVHVDPTNRVLIEDRLFDNLASTNQQFLPRVVERLAYWAALGLGGIAP